jgi:circadian clock protein KaiC
MPALDALIGGGLEEGMSTLISGPSGTGKSSLAARFVHAATQRGERCAMFLFEEARQCSAPTWGCTWRIDANLLTVQQIDPAELSPGEFSSAVMHAVDSGARGRHRQPEWLPERRAGRALPGHLPARAADLPGPARRGQPHRRRPARHAGVGMTNAVDASYLADNVILLRYFEANGEVRQAISSRNAAAATSAPCAASRSPQGLRVGRC